MIIDPVAALAYGLGVAPERPQEPPGRPMAVTAYCATGNPTASGAWPSEGRTVATLDRTIPFGTVLEIEGLGTYVVEDRIGYGSDVDVYLGAEGCEVDAAAFGRQTRTVTIVDPGED